MRFLAAYIMRGRMQAMIMASTLALLSLIVPPVSIVSSASVALVTLRRGASEGLFVLMAACAAAAFLGMFLSMPFQIILIYSLVLWLPVWLISLVLREGGQLSLALEIAVLLGIAGVIGFYLFESDPAAMWRGYLGNIEPIIAARGVPPDQIQQILEVVPHYIPGVIAASTISGLLMGLLLARWWQSVLYNPGGFRQEFLSLRTQPGLAIGSVAVIAVAFVMKGMIAEIAWNVAIPLFVLYTVIGTAIVHVLISAMKAKNILLPIFYVMIIMVPHTLIPLVIIGLCDTWLKLRSKVSNQTSA